MIRNKCWEACYEARRRSANTADRASSSHYVDYRSPEQIARDEFRYLQEGDDSADATSLDGYLQCVAERAMASWAREQDPRYDVATYSDMVYCYYANK